MANWYSDLISDSVSATPSAGFRAPAGSQNKLVTAIAQFDIGTSDFADNDVIAMHRVPWSTRVWGLTGYWPSCASSTTVNVGVYPSDYADSTDATSEDCFGTAVDLNTISTVNTGTDMFEEGTLLGTDRGRVLWSLAGLSANPNDGTSAVIALTLTANPAAQSATEPLLLKLEYFEGA